MEVIANTPSIPAPGASLEAAAEAEMREGDHLLDAGELEAALDHYERALRICERPGDEDLMPLEICLQFCRLSALIRLNRIDEAIDILDQIDLRFSGEDDPGFRFRVAGALRQRACLLEDVGRIDEAVDVLTDLVERYETDEDAHVRREAGVAMVQLGDIASDRRQEADALHWYLRAWPVLEASSMDGPARHATARALYFGGRLLSRAGRDDEAVVLLERLLAGYRDCYQGELEPLIGECIERHGDLLRSLGRPEEALEAWRAAVPLFQARPAEGFAATLVHPILALANGLYDLDRHDEALALYRLLAESPIEGSTGGLPLVKRIAAFKIGCVLEAARRHDEALQAFEAFIERYRSVDELSRRITPGESGLVAEAGAIAAMLYLHKAHEVGLIGHDRAAAALCLSRAYNRAREALETDPDQLIALCLVAYLAWLKEEPFVDALIAKAVLRGGVEAQRLFRQIARGDKRFLSRCVIQAAA